MDRNDLISRSALEEKAYTAVILEPDESGIAYVAGQRFVVDLDDIENAPTVKTYCYFCGQTEHGQIEEKTQGEWVRKEDIIHYIATQYSEHNELVPIWLSIGDLKGGAE